MLRLQNDCVHEQAAKVNGECQLYVLNTENDAEMETNKYAEIVT